MRYEANIIRFLRISSILVFDCDVGEWVGGLEKVQTCAEVINGWYLSVLAKVFHRLRAPFLPPESGLCVFKLWRLPLLGDPTDGCIGCGWRLLKSWNRLLYDEILNILNVSEDVVLYNSWSTLQSNSYALPPKMQSELLISNYSSCKNASSFWTKFGKVQMLWEGRIVWINLCVFKL